MKIGFRFVLSVAILLALSVTACQKESAKSPDPPEKITIAYMIVPLVSLHHIALQKGFYTLEGLDVVRQPHVFGKPALESVLEGKADLAIAGDTPFMFAVMSGRKISVITTIVTSEHYNAIVARTDRGIKTPADLRGKRIGVALGTTGHFFLESFLAVHGIQTKDVRIVDLKPGQTAINAILNGEVDAISYWGHAATQIYRRLAEKGIMFFDENLYSDNACLFAQQEFVKKHPEAIKKVLKALVRAETFAQQNPEESRRLVAEASQTDKATLDEVWGYFNFKVTLDQALIVSLEDQARWAQRNRLTDRKEMPNYLDFIYFDGLQSVKPEAVRVIR